MHRREDYDADRIHSQALPESARSKLSQKRDRLALVFWIWRQVALHVMLTAVAVGAVADFLRARTPMITDLAGILSSLR